VIAIDRFPYRLAMARDGAKASHALNYEEVDVHEALLELTAGRGPDACIDAVGLEAHGHGIEFAYDRTKQTAMLETDRPVALRQAIRECKNGGIVAVVGVYGGFIDKFPMGAVVNRSLTIKSAQCHVHRYVHPLLKRIERGEIDASFVVTIACRCAMRPRAIACSSRSATTARRWCWRLDSTNVGIAALSVRGREARRAPSTSSLPRGARSRG
jgi:threonine dehydrogenase-like Zn-dependent dehydrogenase